MIHIICNAMLIPSVIMLMAGMVNLNRDVSSWVFYGKTSEIAFKFNQRAIRHAILTFCILSGFVNHP